MVLERLLRTQDGHPDLRTMGRGGNEPFGLVPNCPTVPANRGTLAVAGHIDSRERSEEDGT